MKGDIICSGCLDGPCLYSGGRVRPGTCLVEKGTDTIQRRSHFRALVSSRLAAIARAAAEREAAFRKARGEREKAPKRRQRAESLNRVKGASVVRRRERVEAEGRWV